MNCVLSLGCPRFHTAECKGGIPGAGHWSPAAGDRDPGHGDELVMSRLCVSDVFHCLSDVSVLCRWYLNYVLVVFWWCFGDVSVISPLCFVCVLLVGWWQLKYFFGIFIPKTWGKMFTHFDLRIFFKRVGETQPATWRLCWVKSGRVFLEVWKSDQFDWLGGWFKIDGFFRECKGGFYGDFAVSF